MTRWFRRLACYACDNSHDCFYGEVGSDVGVGWLDWLVGLGRVVKSGWVVGTEAGLL